MKPEVLEQFKSIVGSAYVQDNYEDRACYTYDASPILVGKEAVPELIIAPANAEEISQILKLCNAEKIPVIPRGAGSNVSGGTIPSPGCIIMLMHRMNRILKIDQNNLVAELEPGVVTGDFQAEVEKLGLFYPPDPASKGYSTIGGNVAECAGGPRGAKYGVTRDYVLGLEVVLPTGEIIKTGARTMKSVAGYDLTRLITGSEGTLAVITKIIVKLIPLPEAKKTMLAIFDDLYKASELVSLVFRAGIVPTTMELVDNAYIRCIEDYMKIGLPVDADALMLIEVDGDAIVLDRQIERISEICKSLGATVKVAQNDKEADELWMARRAAFASVSKIAPTIIGEDATVPRDKIPEAVRQVREISEKYNLTIAVLGHAGDGNLHATILADERDAEMMKRVDQAAGELFVGTLSLGGTLTGEHGIGQVKAKYLHLEVGEEGMALMKAIKRTFDPNNILNPGQMLGA